MHCEYCGGYVDSDDQNCPSCGARINHQADHQTNKTYNITIDLSDVTDALKHTNEGIKDVTESLRQINEPDDRSSAHAPHVKSYLLWSILSTICCFFPFGIPAIVFAAMVIKSRKYGDLDGALKASKRAKTWTIISFVAGIVMWIYAYAKAN